MSRVRRVFAVGLVLVVTGLVPVVAGCAPSVQPSTSSPATAASASPSIPVASTDPASSPTSITTGGAARRADLAYLVDELKDIHPNPFLEEGEAAFMARVRAIEDRADTLTDAGFMVAVMELMGHRDRDGHSGAWAMAQTGERLHAWPVWLWDFPDGLRAVAAGDADQDLIGARLVHVGDATVDDARTAVEPLVPRDNESNLRANLPMYLTVPEVLDELGLRQPGGAGLVFELLDGSTRELTAEPLPMRAFFEWVTGAYGTGFPTGLPPDDDGPQHLRNRDLAFWTESLTEPAGIYVGYNEVRSTNEERQTISGFAFDILQAAPLDPDQPFVIDLRNNPGGDNTTFRPLRDAVERMARDRPGRVSILAGRSTFSAAGNFVTDLLVGSERASMRLVGESPGGGLNIYGDVRVVTLPASRIVVLVSEDYHLRSRDDDRLALPPDIPVEVTWEDYVAGRDPVLEAALTFGD
jgi:hypothetical protein